MAQEAKEVYQTKCRGCRKPFTGMLHGMSDISLDITDPKREPFYLTNTRWICQTCNRQKGRTPPEQWAALRIGWDLWEQQQTHGPLQKSLPFD
jgi:hypothetical protein